jgi:hypothetical protein
MREIEKRIFLVSQESVANIRAKLRIGFHFIYMLIWINIFINILYPDSVSESYSRIPHLAKNIVKSPLIFGSFEVLNCLKLNVSELFSLE